MKRTAFVVALLGAQLLAVGFVAASMPPARAGRVHDAFDSFRHPELDAPAVHALRRALRDGTGAPAADRLRKLDPSTYGPAPVAPLDLVHADIELRLEPATGQIVEHVRLSLEANVALPVVPLTVAPLAVEGLALVERTEPIARTKSSHTAVVEYDPSTWRLQLTLDTPVAAGEALEVELTLSGQIACDGLDARLPLCQFAPDLSFATGIPFFPTTLSNPDPYTVDLRITVPDGYVAASNAAFREAIDAGEDTTYRFEIVYPTEFLAFAVSDYERHDGAYGDAVIGLYTRPGYDQYADEILAEAVDVLDFYSSLFIAYPFEKLDIIQLSEDFGGGFGPMMGIMMMAGVFDIRPDSWHWSVFVQLQSHELAHQWWGNLVGIRGNDSVVVSEGMAEFSSAFHYESQKGSRSNFVTNAYNYLFSVPPAADVPIASASVYMSPHYQTIVYDKGSLVMDMLRLTLGDEPFAAALQEFFRRYSMGYATLADVQATFEEVSGEDLAWFFDEWYRGTGYPQFVANVNQQQLGRDRWRVRVILTQSGDQVFSTFLPIAWRKADGELHEERVWVDGSTAQLEVETDGPVLGVSVDPYHRVIATVRPSPAADVNLTGEVDGFDLLDLATRYRTGVVQEWNGERFYWPDARYETRVDPNGDGRVDEADLTALLAELPQNTRTVE